MKTPLLLSLALLAALPAFSGSALAQHNDQRLVTVDSGRVHGIEASGIISFKGIPYAAPPVGELRWRVPQPVKHWDAVFEARAFGPACMQAGDLPKSEDCLTLNVWRPTDPSNTSLPVMVWIYGGALARGNTAMYPLDAIARQGVIAVSMNYRLGRLGFFAHPALASESPGDLRGNYGHYDQRAALEWIGRNIAAFGGDPTNVTIFGESAGGGSVLAHLTSPLSRLFNRAIMQSPGIPTSRAAETPLTPLDVAESAAVDYARSLGIDGDGQAALTALRSLPADVLIAGASAPEVIAGLGTGRPVIGVAGAILDGTFLLETPEAAIAAGHQAMVPVIIGANSRDLGSGEANSKDELFALFGSKAPEARSLYDPAGTETLAELKQQVLADKTMVEPSRHLADALARSGQPVWSYRFSYVAESRRDTEKGTLHGYEIPYTLNIPAALVGNAVTGADRTMGELASAYWVAFAKTGDPNGRVIAFATTGDLGTRTSGGGRPEWPRHDPNVDRVINFTNDGIVVGPDPLKARLDLWKTVQEQVR